MRHSEPERLADAEARVSNVPSHVEVNGTSLAYDESGAGKPVVFVHGAISDHRFWAPQVTALADQYRCIALDQRYFGRSWPGGDRPFEISTHSDDLARFVRAIVSEPVHIVATSYGAGVALACAVAHPELFGSLFLNEPGLPSLVSEPRDLAVITEARKELAPVAAALTGNDPGEALEFFVDWILYPGAFASCPREFKTMLYENARTLALQLSAPPPMVTTAQIATLTVPITLTTGEATKPLFSVQVRAAHRAIRHSRLIPIPNAHHGASFENPTTFNAALLAHLSTVTS
jgi:pimeloyl-ACP methyl ester carboxylesterase